MTIKERISKIIEDELKGYSVDDFPTPNDLATLIVDKLDIKQSLGGQYICYGVPYEGE